MANWDSSSDEESVGYQGEGDFGATGEAANEADALPPSQSNVEGVPPEEAVEPGSDGAAAATGTEPEATPDVPPERTYQFPEVPPFTAFVGNLAFSVKETDHLIAAIDECAKARVDQEIVIVGANVCFSRDGKHRGFGYVEVETLDQLKALMQLNNGDTRIAGRRIQLDTANGPNNPKHRENRRKSQDQRRSFNGPASNIDGSKFRGGRYQNRSSFNDKDDNNNNNTNTNNNNAPPMQRTSLKLAPRTKKEGEEEITPNASIFGGAKPRDEQAWESRRRQSQQQNQHQQQQQQESKTATSGGDDFKNANDRRRSSQSGGGRGRGSGGRGDRNNNNNNAGRRGSQPRRSWQNQASPDAATPAAAAPAPAAKTVPAKAVVPAPAPAKPAPPANKFALLMDSDSE